MSPRTVGRPPMPRMLVALVALAAVALAGCSAATTTASFDPTAPCPAEGRQPGAYPDIEAILPADHEGRPPDAVDSGRMRTPAQLGTLALAGIDEVRYAGATWATGGTSGLTVAAFTGEGLDAAAMLEFYATPAEAARRTEAFTRSETTVGGVPAHRLDVLGSDGTGQTIVAWQPADDGPVWVLLAADLGDAKVAEILERLGTR